MADCGTNNMIANSTHTSNMSPIHQVCVTAPGSNTYIPNPLMPANNTAMRAWLAKRPSNRWIHWTRSSAGKPLNNGSSEVVTVNTPPIHHTTLSTWIASRMLNIAMAARLVA